MAVTASPQSEPQVERRGRCRRGFSQPPAGRHAVEITGLAPLRGGAIQENWALDAHFIGGVLAGDQRLAPAHGGPDRACPRASIDCRNSRC